MTGPGFRPDMRTREKGGRDMEQQLFFDRTDNQPLAARMRPKSLEEFAGQTHLLGKGKVLRRLI